MLSGQYWFKPIKPRQIMAFPEIAFTDFLMVFTDFYV
jgi:hypothetical protein